MAVTLEEETVTLDDALKVLPIDFAGGDTGRHRADSSSSSLLPSASAGKACQEEKRVDAS